ncbi:MAG: hypothetical protein NZ561_07340 [Phycisphaerae bacterium]|nr:hypothetical protein [Phycisphaerae bacterium]MDW8262317.1 hypothetical protein [Phycisphaerales bacterium]
MKRWLARLTFSFLAVGVACGYEAIEGFSGRRPGRSRATDTLLAVAAALGVVLFLAAVKARHGGNEQ